MLLLVFTYNKKKVVYLSTAHRLLLINKFLQTNYILYFNNVLSVQDSLFLEISVF